MTEYIPTHKDFLQVEDDHRGEVIRDLIRALVKIEDLPLDCLDNIPTFYPYVVRNIAHEAIERVSIPHRIDAGQHGAASLTEKTEIKKADSVRTLE